MSFSTTVVFNELTIALLWEDLRSGDKSALEAIYRQYIEDLFSFGMSLHADDTIVKDAIQDIFIDLWSYRAKLSTDVVVKQYLFKSLSNRIQRELGKNAKRSRLHLRSEVEISAESIESELVKTQAEEELKGKMNEALKSLPIRQKEVIQYLFFEKLNYEETAHLLDITIRSTYTLAWKAINALKKAITVLTLFLVAFNFH